MKEKPLTLTQVEQHAHRLAEIATGREVLKAIITLQKAGFNRLDVVYQPMAVELIRSMTVKGGGWVGSTPGAILRALQNEQVD